MKNRNLAKNSEKVHQSDLLYSWQGTTVDVELFMSTFYNNKLAHVVDDLCVRDAQVHELFTRHDIHPLYLFH